MRKHLRARLHLLFLLPLLLLLIAAAPMAQNAPDTRNIEFDMYFNAAVVNDASCAMSVSGRRIRFGEAVTNPAMSCPDLLAWKVYVEAVQQNFVVNWISGDLMWPASPMPVCAAGAGKDCCTPGARNNPGYDQASNPSRFCPFAPASPWPAQPVAVSTAVRRDTSRWPGMADPHSNAGLSTNSLSFYNRSMFDYVFKNGLYHTNGLTAVMKNANADLATNAPFRAVSRPGKLTTVNFPIDAWMIRSQWIKKEDAIASGVKEDPRFPFIKVIVGQHQPYNFNPAVYTPGEYWLMSFHISTKDIPAWFWADFDHVNTPGRCDFTGCNDGYGYDSPQQVTPGLSANFTSPGTQMTSKGQGYVQNAVYGAGQIRPALKSIFDQLGIGTTPQDKASLPVAASSGWRSYRLRGTQWDFTDPAGRPTYTGATASNGGIVTGSSCISCHATAGTLANSVSPQILGLYQNWAGAPNPANFNLNARPATNLILQNDFVWGFIHTVPLAPRKDQVGSP